MSDSSSTINAATQNSQWQVGQAVVGNALFQNLSTVTLAGSPSATNLIQPLGTGLWGIKGNFLFTAPTDDTVLISISVTISQPAVAIPYTQSFFYDLTLDTGDTQVMSYSAILPVTTQGTITSPLTTTISVTYEVATATQPTLIGNIINYRLA